VPGSVSSEKPSYEELSEEVASLRATVAEQAGLIEKLMAEIAELRARLNMNSRNSSKPPSSDGYAKPAPKSRRKRSGKKPGKQPGDPDAISHSVLIPMRRRSTRRRPVRTAATTSPTRR